MKKLIIVALIIILIVGIVILHAFFSQNKTASITKSLLCNKTITDCSRSHTTPKGVCIPGGACT